MSDDRIDAEAADFRPPGRERCVPAAAFQKERRLLILVLTQILSSSGSRDRRGSKQGPSLILLG